MKRQIQSLLLAAAVVALPVLVQAQHYPAGAEGIKGASLPPPGVYLRDYNFFYTAGSFPGGPPDFNVIAYVQAPRLIWMTDWKILGATYGMDIIVPFGPTRLKVGTEQGELRGSSFGLGDIQIEPLLLSWHEKQYDVAAGYAVWAPTGDFDMNKLVNHGDGFWTHMLTLGGVWYPDEKKTWAISLLNRYEISSKQSQTDITPGETYTLEWGLSKTVCKNVDLGAIGYYQQEVTKTTGADSRAYVVGVGPEISTFYSKLGMFVSLRYVCEVEARDRTRGHTITLTLTKRF